MKGYPKLCRGKWKVKLGNRTHVVHKEIDTGTIGNLANVRFTRNVQDKLQNKIKQEYAECFYKEGEPLLVTRHHGSVEHHIELIGEKPVFVQPRRYPFAKREMIKSHPKKC